MIPVPVCARVSRVCPGSPGSFYGSTVIVSVMFTVRSRRSCRVLAKGYVGSSAGAPPPTPGTRSVVSTVWRSSPRSEEELSELPECVLCERLVRRAERGVTTQTRVSRVLTRRLPLGARFRLSLLRGRGVDR